MYVDESGDPGFNSPTDHYILSAFVVKDTSWTEVLRHLIDMRRQLKRHFGFPIRAELKGSGLIDPRRLPSHKRVIFQNVGKRNVRVALYKHYMQSLCDLHIKCPQTYTFSIYANKPEIQRIHQKHHDVLRMAWERLFDRFNAFLKYTAGRETGIVIPDQGEITKIRSLLRRMRHYNPITRRTGDRYLMSINWIIEDPFFINSQHSYFIQTADMIAHAVYRFVDRRRYRRYRLWKLYSLLDCQPSAQHIPSFIHKAVTHHDPANMGIVRIPQP